MKHLAALFLALLSSCAQPLTQPTEDDKRHATECMKRYHSGLVSSIARLDDKKTPANEIGKVAVYDNLELLRKWMLAAVAHISRRDAHSAQLMIQCVRESTPSETHLASATSIVLEKRSH
jgi:hypothetical protein